MKVSKQLLRVLIISTIFSSSLFVGVYVYGALNARAILISPRIGAPICASASDGTWDSTPLGASINIIVGIEPNDLMVPLDWLNINNWEIGLAHSSLDNCSIIDLTIVAITAVSNPFTSLGLEDSSIWTKNAVEIEASIPQQIDACLYDLYIAYGMELDELQTRNTEVGSYFSDIAVGLGTSPFVISEPNAVYVPLDTDATPNSANGNDPFSLIHITDVHTASNLLGEWTNQLKMENLAEAMSIWAPDVVVETGDITNAPDHYPIEYQIAYNYFLKLGLPLIICNGNHDHGNLALWKQYFGALFTDVNWMGAHFIQINTATSSGVSGRAVNWVLSLLKEHRGDQWQGPPIFLNMHIPLIDINARQAQSYGAVLMDAMINNGGTAVLQGHNHYDMVMDADKALPIYLDLVKNMEIVLDETQFSDACHIPSRVGNTAPFGGSTKLIITTSGGKDERGSKLRENDLWPDYQGYNGYRRMTLVENTMINYTYDLDDDGDRDPSYSTPLWMLNGSLDFDSLHPEFGANYTITNNLTEGIDSARVRFILPLIPAQNWVPAVSMGTEGVDYHLRYSVSNSTHQFFEYRIAVPKRINQNTPSIVEFNMELV